MKISLQNVFKAYGKESVLNNVNIQVEEGKLLSILGSSGAGKTTILKIISGLLHQDNGQVMIDGTDISNLPAEERNIGYVFQKPLLFPHMTVEENIRFGLEVKKWDSSRIKNRVNELIKLLQIEGLEKRMPSMISGGQQQRVAIARTMAPEPDIILMDEPFSSLDPKLRYEMGELIKEIQKKCNLTIILVTHDRNESIALSNEIALLINGKIAQIAKPKDIYYRPQNRDVAKFMGLCNFISGKIVGEQFYTDIGIFRGIIEKEGKKILVLRPEQIKIDVNGNNFIVRSFKSIGKQVIYSIGRKNTEILVETYGYEKFSIGQRVGLIFPKGNLHFIS